MKTLSYDSSLTGGADEINSYRVVVTDEQSVTVADTGYVTGDEMVLSGIVPDEYKFTVQGAIQGGGNCIVVAESVSQFDISSNNISLVLADPAPGVAGEISLRVYSSLDGEYSPESASIIIEVGDFSKTLTAGSGNGLTFARSGEDDFGAYWDFLIAESAAIPTGACIITLTVQSNEGSTPVKGVVAGVLFPDIGIKGVIDSKTGLVNNEFQIDWQYMDTPDFYEMVDISAVAYGNGKFIAFCDDAYGNESIIESTDGTNWSRVDDEKIEGSLAFIISSSDLRYINDRFFSESFHGLYWSYDGYVWNEIDYDFGSEYRYNFQNIAYYNGYWYSIIARYDSSASYYARYTTCWTRSKDLVSWSTPADCLSRSNSFHYVPHLKGLIYANGYFYASSNDSGYFCSMSSRNGSTWTGETSASGNYFKIDSLVYGGNRWVLYKEGSGDLYSVPRITDLTADDWLYSGNNIELDYSINDICYGNGYFIAACDLGNILRSTNGKTWTEISFNQEDDFNAVCYGNGVFVAVGNSGLIATSKNGSTWNIVDVSENPAIQYSLNASISSIGFGNGDFVLGNSKGYCANKSLENHEWNIYNKYAYNIAYGNDKFMSSSSVIAFGGGRFFVTGSVTYSSVTGTDITPKASFGSGGIKSSELGESWDTEFTTENAALSSGFSQIVPGKNTVLFIEDYELYTIKRTGYEEFGTLQSLSEGSTKLISFYFNGHYYIYANDQTGYYIFTQPESSDEWIKSELPLELQGFCTGTCVYSDSIVLVLTESGEVFVSEDGQTWLPSYDLATDIGDVKDVEYSDGLFLILGTEKIAYFESPSAA